MKTSQHNVPSSKAKKCFQSFWKLSSELDLLDREGLTSPLSNWDSEPMTWEYRYKTTVLSGLTHVDGDRRCFHHGFLVFVAGPGHIQVLQACMNVMAMRTLAQLQRERERR